MVKRSGKHKVKVVQAAMPYPVYYQQPRVVIVDRTPRKTKSKVKHKKMHKRVKQAKEKDLFEQYEAEVNALYGAEKEEKETKRGKHKIKKEKDLFDQYESELSGMESFLPEDEEDEEYEEEEIPHPSRRASRHKLKRLTPDVEMSEYESALQRMAPVSSKTSKHKLQQEQSSLWVTPEDIPEEEEDDWFKRQQIQWEKQAEDFKNMAESGKKFALGTYQTVEKARRGASRAARGLSRFLKSAKAKLTHKEATKRPVQVFIEPTTEGDYAVYGQFKQTSQEFKPPKQPIKIYTEPLREEEYVKYGEW